MIGFYAFFQDFRSSIFSLWSQNVVHKWGRLLAISVGCSLVYPHSLGAMPGEGGDESSRGMRSLGYRTRLAPRVDSLSIEKELNIEDKSSRYQQELLINMRQMTRYKSERILADLVEDGVLSSEDMHTMLEYVDNLLLHPLDLNHADEESLRQIPLISDYQIAQFIRYRAERGGRIALVEELALIPSWDEETVRLLLPLLSVGEEEPRTVGRLSELLRGGRTSLSILSGFLSEHPRPDYEGTASKLSLRWQYRGARGRLTASLGADRDYYEPWSYEGRKGFDSYHMHIGIKDLGWIRKLVFGDYRISWGEGLVLSHGTRVANMMSLRVGTGGGVRPAVGLSETSFGRGGAVELGKGSWGLSAFVSQHRIDGRLGEDGLLYGLGESGLHRSARELRLRNGVSVRELGVRIGYEVGGLSLSAQSVGVNFLEGRLRRPPGVNPSVLQLQDRDSYSNHSLSYRYKTPNGRLMLSGELALSGATQGWGWVQALVYKSQRSGDFRLSLRRISERYWAYLGRTYTHYRSPHDEEGVSLFYETKYLLPHSKLALGVDLYRPMLKEMHPRGHKAGKLLRMEYEYHRQKAWTLRGRWAFHTKEGEASRHNLSLEGKWQEKRYSWVVGVSASKSSDKWGWASYLRGYANLSRRWLLSFSSAYFDVPQWSGRLYYYEPRLAYEYGSRLLYGRGYLLSMNCSIRLGERLSLQGRASTSRVISSSARKHELAIAIVYK